MRVITGRVVGGKVEFETGLREGTLVAVLAADEAGFRLSAEEEEELAAALDEIRAGQFTDGRELVRELKASSR